MRTLAPGGVDTYHLSIPAGAIAVLQGTTLSTELGKVRLRLSDPDGALIDDTCSGLINRIAGHSGVFTLTIQQCNGSSGGDYTVSLNVVSGGDGNCGRPLQCGATPDGTGFTFPGEVDSFRMDLNAGERGVRLKLNFLEPPIGNESGAPYVQVFDPNGTKVVPGTCPRDGDTVQIPEPIVGGVYTALVSPCIGMRLRAYRVELSRSSCANGPTITHFGVSNGHGEPWQPTGFDQDGRPIFDLQLGYGLLLVLEARIGASNRGVGNYTVSHEDNGVEKDADMQMILSEPLGDGDPRVCDITPPDFGGVPATVPFEFDHAGDAIDDMGCRFDDGAGQHIGHRDLLQACTFTNQFFGYSFVDRTSYVQFCTSAIAPEWAFPLGRTIVRARVKDIRGNFGEPREIVVQISGVSTATPTPTATPLPPTPTSTRRLTNTPSATLPATRTVTRTRTATRTRTPGTPGTPTVTPTSDGSTPTPTYVGGCAGDCNDDGTVTINEVITTVGIALGNAPLSQCPAADANGDGSVAINDIVQAVNSTLVGCSP